ncbi:YihY/virulence factor BrkB family protein [Ramlibacter aquaticus]|uniref:YihY/virulence factor BrkB family protein n=3 Tax=Ramlibacter TaxID=174951 RepID=A0ABR9SK93_9BURK|nr:YihY/virulence factor BrkB family protein [Ramlibacter aquaticus]
MADSSRAQSTADHFSAGAGPHPGGAAARLARAPAWVRRLWARVMRPFSALKRAGGLWSHAGGLSMSAAMSFYGILSLAPLLIVVVAIFGLWMDRSSLQSGLVRQIGAVVGAQGASVIQGALQSAQTPSEGIVASLIGFSVLLFGATGVFTELQQAFERVWSEGGVAPASQGWWHTASLRLRGVAYILAFGFLLLVSLAVTTLLDLASSWAGGWIAFKWLLRLLSEALAFGICTALFVALMRISAGPKPRMRYLVVGSAIGAIFFTLGRHLLALYLSTAAVVSSYGAAGSLVVMLMWIYFSSAVLLFAAGCARALEDTHPAAARPPPGAPGAVPPGRGAG